jgi:hypothetical protein
MQGLAILVAIHKSQRRIHDQPSGIFLTVSRDPAGFIER